MPFFAEHRLLLIEDSGFFKNANQQLAEYIPSIPEETIILFVESEVDKRGKLYKAVSKKGSVVEFTAQNEQTLTRWILGILKTEGKMITSGAMKQFLEKTGTDMERIRQELEKLICYCMEKESITEEDVAVICSEQTENKIFDMINAMAEKKQKKAMELYYDLLALKEPPMRILYLITRQFNLLMHRGTQRRSARRRVCSFRLIFLLQRWRGCFETAEKKDRNVLQTGNSAWVRLTAGWFIS